MATKKSPSGADVEVPDADEAPKRSGKRGARRLAAHVHVTNPETGDVSVFPVNTLESDLPDWASKAITNPKAFTDEPEDAEEA